MRIDNQCSSCRLSELCLPMGLGDSDTRRFDQIVSRRRIIPRDGMLYRANDRFTSLYAISKGHFKTYEINADGEQLITGFQLVGELLGMNAIGSGRHSCNATALEDSEVCEIPFARLEQLCCDTPALQRQLLRMMSQEISQTADTMMLLGRMCAEQRIAAFLVNLGSRHAARGHSSKHFRLGMTREDIGNYLGLTMETVSRLMSKFQRQGLIAAQHREIEFKNPGGLMELVGH